MVSRTRLLAALLLVLVSGAFYWLSAAKEFAVEPAAVDIQGVHYTDVTQVRAALELGRPAGTNIFRLPTAQMERAIASLPAVRSVRVRATLPNRLAVTIRERAPIFAWKVAGRPGSLTRPATCSRRPRIRRRTRWVPCCP